MDALKVRLGEIAQAMEVWLERAIDGRGGESGGRRGGAGAGGRGRVPGNLREAMKYSALGGGKRLRPGLVVLSAQAVGWDGAVDGQSDHAVMCCGGAMELIHCFSLVHDDLPAMDDDDMRRGRPTLHKHTNEAMAILAGDMMMGLAFELLAGLDGNTGGVGSGGASAGVSGGVSGGGLVSELAIATNNMIVGQVHDTLPDFEASMPGLERLQTIHRNKTGALIRGSCRMGAIAGGASEAQLQALTEYGEAIGLMFQAVDDLLDVTQSAEQLGKAAGKDADMGKLTYPGLLGVDETREQIRQMETQAIAALEPLGEAAEPLRVLCRYMAVRTK